MTDHIIMLLSTDWFLPYWAEVGIDVEETKKAGIQQGCRQIVAQIMDGEDNYFLCDLTEERIQETASRVLVLLSRWEVEPRVLSTWKELAALSHEALTASFACSRLIRELLPVDATGRVPELDPAIRLEIKRWAAYAPRADILRDVSVQSGTEWDLRIQHFLSGPPHALANLLWSVVLHRRFRGFWADLRERLTPEQLSQLLSWFRAMVTITYGEDPPVLPAYMN